MYKRLKTLKSFSSYSHWYVSIYLFFIFSLSNSFAQALYSLDNIPSPKERGQDYYVSDPDHILDNKTVNLLDNISVNIEKQTAAEFVIVIVNDYQGDDDFEFAFNLFNKWGIGKKEANNGLLLFVAKNKRQYRFITGYGMEGIFPDVYLRRVGEKYLVPNFRNNDYDQGLLESSQFIAQILQSPDSIKELEKMMPEAVPFFSFRNVIFKNTLLIVGVFLFLYLYIHLVGKKLTSPKQKLKPIAPIFYGLGCMGLLMFFTIFLFAFIFNNVEEVYQVKNLPYFILVFCGLIVWFKIANAREAIKKSYGDEEDKSKALRKFNYLSLIPSLLAPLALFEVGATFRYLNKNRNRFNPPDESGSWERIKRTFQKSETNKYLNSGQRKEEKLNSRKYEIWKDIKTQKVQLIAWDINKKYSECPKCHYFTLLKNKKIILKKATYSSGGKGEKRDECENCSYSRFIESYTIAKLTRSSSSGGSSSSSGGGGGSSSSSGGGSFGGGSSGGGGAGGRW